MTLRRFPVAHYLVNYRPPARERWGGGFLFESGAGRFLAGVLRPLVPMGRCD